MKVRSLIAAGLAGVLLLPAGCTDIPKMEIPSTDMTAFTQIAQTDLEEWENAESKTEGALPLARHEVELAAGGTAALYALDTGEEPSAGTDEITSVSAELALNSAAVQLGEYGTVRELAESELYRWTDRDEFDYIRYTQPKQLSDTRCAVQLRLENSKVGMEQLVCYTDLGGGIARIDRLWRTITDPLADTGSPVFDETAACLLSSDTL